MSKNTLYTVHSAAPQFTLYPNALFQVPSLYSPPPEKPALIDHLSQA